MESTRFNTCKYYKACNVLFFNQLTGQNAGNFTKKLCKHLTSTKKTFNKMTPKEKAKELVDKMQSQTYSYQKYAGAHYTVEEIGWEAGKKCALIAVEEIILSAPFEPVNTDWDEAGSSAQYWYPQKLEDSAKWWGEVKQEIEKL